jgi:hypothetical protein
VVDLGYSGTIQHCLQKILDHEKVPVKTHGLYLVTGSGVRKIQRAGTAPRDFWRKTGSPCESRIPSCARPNWWSNA